MPPASNDDWKAFSTKPVNQPYVKDLDQLYAKAESVEGNFKDVMNKLAEMTESRAMIAPLKGRERATRKAKYKYKDDNGPGIGYYRLTDILRGTLVFPDLETLYGGAATVLKFLKGRIKEFNDRYQNPKKGGYRDIQMVFELDEFMCELQLSTEAFMTAKETTGHRNYEVYRELMAAVDDGDLKAVNDTLEFGRKSLGSNMESNFMQQDERIRLLPHRAAKAGHADILECLLDFGGNPNAQDDEGDTPLHHAIFHGHERCVWLLLNKFKCKTDIENKNDECSLLKGYFMLYGGRRPEPHRRSMITLLQLANIDQVKRVIAKKDEMLQKRLQNSRLLVDYAADNDIEAMEELLKDFDDPNSSQEGETALQAAVRAGRQKAVELLLEFKASTDTGEGEKLIVQEALDKGYYEIADILIKAGADCKNTNWKILVKYAEEGNIQKMRKLLDLGIDPNPSKDEVSALQAAVRGRQQEAVEFLLKCGA